MNNIVAHDRNRVFVNKLLANASNLHTTLLDKMLLISKRELFDFFTRNYARH